MSHNRSIPFWICSLVVIVLTNGPVLRAADSSAPSGTDKVVPIKSGDATTTVKVHEADPYRNLHVPAPTDKYDPTRYSLNQTSSLANKSFSSNSDSLSKKSADLVHNQTAFTKTYNQTNTSGMGKQDSNTRYSTSVASDYNRNDSQDVKHYGTSNSTMAANRSTAFSKTSSDQGHTAVLGGQKTSVYSSGLAKQYLGPGAQKVPDGTVKENVVIEHVSDIPNHPLSVDEVRGLINHGFKPTDENKLDEPSKPLNDPDYKPEVSPDPIETVHVPVTDDDKNAPLPSPGMMAQPPPENSDPLPQH